MGLLILILILIVSLVCAGTLKTAAEADEQAELDFIKFMSTKQDK